MALPNIEDARKLNDQELADAIVAAKRELFELRFQQATRRLEKPHQFKHVKHRIAQLMTVERERQLEAATETSPTPQASTEAETQEPVADTQPDSTQQEE